MSESRSHVAAPSSDSTKRVMLQIWQPRLFSEQRMTVCNNAALHYPPQGPLLEKCAANLFNFQFHPDYLQTEIAQVCVFPCNVFAINIRQLSRPMCSLFCFGPRRIACGD